MKGAEQSLKKSADGRGKWKWKRSGEEGWKKKVGGKGVIIGQAMGGEEIKY